MQLASKMRFISAQLVALLEGDLYLRNARHANAMAQRLRAGVEAGIADGSVTAVSFSQPTQANGVFAVLPDGVADALRESFASTIGTRRRTKSAGCAPRHVRRRRRRLRRRSRAPPTWPARVGPAPGQAPASQAR
jgi:threonine aldolase